MRSEANGKDHSEDRQGTAAGSQDPGLAFRSASIAASSQHLSQHHKSGKKLRAYKAKVIS